jgi:Fe-S cluster assembly scaffold protein SufB
MSKEEKDNKTLEGIGDYKYGFHDRDDNYAFKSQKGLSREVVEQISHMKGEPQWMLDFRLKALEHFLKRPMPTWGPSLKELNFDEIYFYVKPTEKQEKSWEDVPDDIKRTFDKLGVPEAERKFLAGLGAQYESEMVYHSIQEHLEKQGVIFVSIEDGLKKYPDLFREYFGTVIPIEDNKFAALNSAVWSGGSFVYVPKGVNVDLPLQAYFRLNTANVGQFERTLIIVDEGASVHYVEGCFLEGAQVRTRHGEKPIEDMRVGDEVMTHQGRWRKVYHTQKRPYHGDIYSIRFQGDSGRELRVTDKHPLLVVRPAKLAAGNRAPELSWSTAESLHLGDYLVVPVPQSIAEPVPATHGSIGAREADPLAKMVNDMWQADGDYDPDTNRFHFAAVSSDQAYAFRDACLILGIACSVNRAARGAAAFDTYAVDIAAPFSARFGNIVGVNAPDGDTRHSPLAIDENFMYLPIREIAVAEMETEVYNFSVEEDESYVAEGVISHNCTAPQYTTDSFHSGVIEIVVKKGARSRYSTIQNWSTNVYNLVTQRAKVFENASHEWTDANLGSRITMKYPSCYLMEPGAHGAMLSMAFAGPGQTQDAGGKMYHFAPNTSSKVTSKSISKGGGRASFRGLLKVYKGAKGVKSNTVCDALLLDPQSRSDTYPSIEIDEDDVTIGHEASVSKVGEEQLFYLMSRGLSEEEATTMVVAGFIEPLVKELPMEYAVEMNRLIQLQMEGSVG